jgi:WD40 repeat protein
VFSIEYDRNYDDGTLFADRPTGEAIAIGQLGVDPDVLAVSPGGNTATIAVGGYNGNTAVYTFNGTTISAPTVVNTGPAAAAWAVRFNPAGDLLAVGTDEGIVRFWSIPLVSAVPTGSSITAKALSLVSALAFSPQGTHIAIGFDQETDIFNVATRAFVARASASDIVDAVTFSASGAALISGENSCGRVLLCAD